MNNSNFYELETKRLLLRKFRMEDIHDLYEYGSDEDVVRYVLWNKYNSIDDAVSYVNFVENKYDNGNNNVWAIELKEDAKLIGAIDFVSYDEKNSRADLGYVLNQNYWNKGLMTEAVELVLQHSFETLNLHKVSASAIEFNIGSYKVMEKVGMFNEGSTRDHFIKNDTFYTIVNYSILSSEYTKKYVSNNE